MSLPLAAGGECGDEAYAATSSSISAPWSSVGGGGSTTVSSWAFDERGWKYLFIDFVLIVVVVRRFFSLKFSALLRTFKEGPPLFPFKSPQNHTVSEFVTCGRVSGCR